MERTKATKAHKAVLRGEEWEDLKKLRSFVQSEVPGGGALSSTCHIDTSTGTSNGVSISGKFTTTCIGDPGTQKTTDFRFECWDAILLVFQAVTSSPTLTELAIVLGGIVAEAFSAVSTSRSLATLNITCNNVDSEHVKAISRCFTGNSTLRSCTLRLPSCDGLGHPWIEILRPLSNVEQTEGLKELVMNSTLDDGCRLCREAIAALITRNITLEKLEVGDRIIPRMTNSHVDRVLMASAVACNATLQEIRFQTTVAEFKELVSYLVPLAHGRQANSTLSTLKLTLIEGESVLDCVTEVARLVESNTTLKHLQLLQESWGPRATVTPVAQLPRSPHFWQRESKHSSAIVEKQNREQMQWIMVMESRLQGELEQMLKNELQRNVSLVSLNLGWWQLLRLGDGHVWQMTYEGPCLKPHTGECPSPSSDICILWKGVELLDGT